MKQTVPQFSLNFDNQRWSEYYTPYERTVLLFITNGCNLRCTHCFNELNRRKERQMSPAYVERVVKANQSIKKFDLMGGEPTLHKELDQILRILINAGKTVGLYTNGRNLSSLPLNYSSLKLIISFQSINSQDHNRRPLSAVKVGIERVIEKYPVKLVFLMDKTNKYELTKVATYVEENFSSISRLTIGAIRDENDYWNNDSPSVLPFAEYRDQVQWFLQHYNGRLNIDIFSKGVLRTPKMPSDQPNQVNRFRCVYAEGRIADCLYTAAASSQFNFDPDKHIEFPGVKYCNRSGLAHCLADKIRLVNMQLGEKI